MWDRYRVNLTLQELIVGIKKASYWEYVPPHSSGFQAIWVTLPSHYFFVDKNEYSYQYAELSTLIYSICKPSIWIKYQKMQWRAYGETWPFTCWTEAAQNILFVAFLSEDLTKENSQGSYIKSRTCKKHL